MKVHSKVQLMCTIDFIQRSITAEELHISFRTAARIVEKLEQNGYIVEVGRSVLNGRGRPTRVFQLLR